MRLGVFDKYIGLTVDPSHLLEGILDYTIKNKISLFKISSDCVSSLNDSDKLKILINKIKKYDKRLVIHVEKFDNLNSQLMKMTGFLDGLGYHHKIVLPVNGVTECFENIVKLSKPIKQRLVLLSDSESLVSALDFSTLLSIPVVCEATGTLEDIEGIKWCSKTWSDQDGVQIIHYKPKDSLNRVDEFIGFINHIQDDIDVLLEDNLTCIKFINCISDRTKSSDLEKEWSKYKYSILEKSQLIYLQIRQVLKDKENTSAIYFYRLIEEGLLLVENKGQAINTLHHVWGYFKKHSTLEEKQSFLLLVDQYHRNETDLVTVKDYLYHLAKKYKVSYLLNSLYFDLT